MCHSSALNMCIHHLNKGKLTERFNLKLYNIYLSVSDGFLLLLLSLLLLLAVVLILTHRYMHVG